MDGALVDANENPSGLPCSDHLLVDDDRHAVVREAEFLQDLVAKDVVELVAAHGTGNLRLIVSPSLRRAPRCRGCCGSSTSPGGSDDTCGEDRVTHVVRVFPADDANVVSGLQSNRVARRSRYDSQQHPLAHFGSNFSWTVYGSSCTTTTLQRRFKRYFRGLGGRTSRVSAC